ncbi:MAG: extracellular solute-binding protein, partial [Clostridia bacterium]|nr:extracellular solute-binding protein [Clostridia bacterium]
LSVSALLAACAKDPIGHEATSAAVAAPVPDESTEDPNAPKYDKDGYLISDLPDMDFGNAKVTVYYWSDVELKEYEAEKQTGELVNDAIFKRNAQTEEKLKIELAFLSSPGNNGSKADFTAKIGSIYKAGDTDIDLISSYSRTTAICAEQGYCAELSSLPYLDFSKPWWPESLTDIVPINNKIYFASGDASINVLHFMYGVYYNKDLASSMNLPNLVELADNRQWTIDKMIEVCSNAYQDINNDGKKDSGDGYGITTTNFNIDAFYTGSGLKLVEQDPEKVLVISPDFFSAKADALCTKLGGWFQTANAYMGSGWEENFVAGNTLFCNNRCKMAETKLQEVPFKYGILPTPMYDENQENYITVVGNPFSLYAIFSNTADKERSAAVLETWAAEAYRTTTPAQFELNMKSKYSEVSDDSRMFDIIKKTVCFDIGRLFNPEIGDITDIFFAAVESNSNWSVKSKANQKILPKKIAAIVDNFAKIEQ